MDCIENRAASPDPPPPPPTGNLTVRCEQDLTVRRTPRSTPVKAYPENGYSWRKTLHRTDYRSPPLRYLT
jgi:hypothetical protein